MQFLFKELLFSSCVRRFIKPNSVGDYSCVKGLVKIQAEGIFVDDVSYMSGVVVTYINEESECDVSASGSFSIPN